MTPPFRVYSLVAELANTPQARERGLMDRMRLEGSDGMLFLFDAPTQAPFWNQRTFLPLDILFADASGSIVDRIAMCTIVETDGRPVQYTPRAPYTTAFEVLRGRTPANVTQLVFSPLSSLRAPCSDVNVRAFRAPLPPSGFFADRRRVVFLSVPQEVRN